MPTARAWIGTCLNAWELYEETLQLITFAALPLGDPWSRVLVTVRVRLRVRVRVSIRVGSRVSATLRVRVRVD